MSYPYSSVIFAPPPAQLPVTVEWMGEGIMSVKLNRPHKRNALDHPTVRLLTETLNTLASEPSVKAVLLSGEGGTFCAGGDLEHMRRMGMAPPETNLKDAGDFALLFDTIRRFPKPIVGVAERFAYGGAMALLANCDKVVALEDTKFAVPDIKFGMRSATTCPHILQAIGADNSKILLGSGNIMTAQQMQACGLVDTIASPETKEAVTRRALEDALRDGKRVRGDTPPTLPLPVPRRQQVPTRLGEMERAKRQNHNDTLELVEVCHDLLLSGRDDAWDAIRQYTVHELAASRSSALAQHGLAAVFTGKGK